MRTRRLVLVSMALPWLGACGFRLRQPPVFAFQRLALLMPATSTLTLELRRQLEGTGQLTVVDDPKQAQVQLHSPGEQRERTVVSYTSSGEVREFQLRISFKFRLSTPDGRELLPESEIQRQMDQSYSESSALSKEQEASMLYQSMQSDIVQQVMRRLATVKL